MLGLAVFAPTLLAARQIATPAKGQGQIVFYRPAKAIGAALRFEVSTGVGYEVGNIRNGSIVTTAVAPGTHQFRVRSPSIGGEDTIAVQVAEGQTVYVECEVRLGWPAGRTKFMQRTPAQAQSKIAQM